MKCKNIQKSIPLFLDGQLQIAEHQKVKQHLENCADCQKEAIALRESWDLLDQWEDIEPDPTYISRFWTDLSNRKSWKHQVLQNFKQAFSSKRLVPAMAAICLFIIAGVLAIQNFSSVYSPNVELAELTYADLEIVENIELVENLEVISDIDFLEDLDVIEEIESLETSKFKSAGKLWT